MFRVAGNRIVVLIKELIKLNNEKHSYDNNKPDTSILIRYILGISSEKEKSEVLAWLEENPENESTLLQIAQLYYSQRTKQRIQARNPMKAFNNVQHQLQKKMHRVYKYRVLILIASVISIASLGINFYFLKPNESDVQYITMQTNAGMRTNFTLPDGTDVYLNSGTKLTYPICFDTDERRVELNGEGYFKVAHDAKRPFIVNIADKAFELEVLGTEFNMQAYATDEFITTILVKGSVRLAMETTSGIRKTVVLEPSQKANYNPEKKNLHIAYVNPMYETAWIEGKIMFKDTPLPEVLNRLSHFYNVHFQIEDQVINQYTFTGVFEQRHLTQVLDYLSISSQIKYKIIVPEEDDSEEVKQTYVILTRR